MSFSTALQVPQVPQVSAGPLTAPPRTSTDPLGTLGTRWLRGKARAPKVDLPHLPAQPTPPERPRGTDLPSAQPGHIAPGLAAPLEWPRGTDLPSAQPPPVHGSISAPFSGPISPEATGALVAQARRLGLGEPVARRLRWLHNLEEHRGARGLLFCVALVLVQHPQTRRRSLDQLVRKWLSLGARLGAREAWERLAGNAGFWNQLGDSHRRLVAQRLRRHPAHPDDTRCGIENLLGDLRFRRSNPASKRDALLDLGPGSATPPGQWQ